MSINSSTFLSSNQELNPTTISLEPPKLTPNSNGEYIFLKCNEFEEAVDIYLRSSSTRQTNNILGETGTQGKINLPMHYSGRSTNSVGCTGLDIDGSDRQRRGRPNSKRAGIPSMGSNFTASPDSGNSELNSNDINSLMSHMFKSLPFYPSSPYLSELETLNFVPLTPPTTPPQTN